MQLCRWAHIIARKRKGVLPCLGRAQIAGTRHSWHSWPTGTLAGQESSSIPTLPPQHKCRHSTISGRSNRSLLNSNRVSGRSTRILKIATQKTFAPVSRGTGWVLEVADGINSRGQRFRSKPWWNAVRTVFTNVEFVCRSRTHRRCWPARPDLGELIFSAGGDGGSGLLDQEPLGTPPGGPFINVSVAVRGRGCTRRFRNGLAVEAP